MTPDTTLAAGWIASDLDGTLFGRKATLGAVPATWNLSGDTPTPSSWMPVERHRLLAALAERFPVVAVTARDQDSYSRVRIEGIPLQHGAVIANGAVLLQPGTLRSDPDWDEEMWAQLAPWMDPLREVAAILNTHGRGLVRARLVMCNTPHPAYLVAKAAHNFWSEEAGLLLREAIAHFPGRVAEHGAELQVLPPPVSKMIGLQAFIERYAEGQAPLLALGDMPEDAPFMSSAAFMATPSDSRLAQRWHDGN